MTFGGGGATIIPVQSRVWAGNGTIKGYALTSSLEFFSFHGTICELLLQSVARPWGTIVKVVYRWNYGTSLKFGVVRVTDLGLYSIKIRNPIFFIGIKR